MIRHKFLRLGLLIFFIHACAETPSIETHHGFIPSKKDHMKTGDTVSEPTKQKPASIPDSAPVAMPAPVITTTTMAPTPPSSTPLTSITSFFFSSDKTEKPHSATNFSTDSRKIGVILPITGKNANLGQRALNSIRLGLGLDGKDPSFSIAIYDNQSSPDLAPLGVEKLLRDDNVVAILGGLSSKEAQAISSRAEFFQVPFFSFSQKSGLTDNSEYIFRNSITPEMQVDRLLQYAFKNLGAKRFAVLYPNEPYGVEFANKYWDLVLAGGGEVVAAQAYDPKDTDLNIYVQKLVGLYYPEARQQEYKDRLKEIADKNKEKALEQAQTNTPVKKKNTREHEVKESVLSPIVDFDVLFVPDSGKALGQVMAFMKNNDVTQMTYLGTNIWNTPDLGRRAGPGATNVFFVDANITSDEQKNSEFHTKYVANYSEDPSLVEAQIYEAAKFLRDTIGSSSISRSSLASQLAILGHRKGAYTDVHMNNNHEIERPLNIFSLSQGAIQKTE